MLNNNKNLSKQVDGGYTERVEGKLTKGNDVTNVKKENYIIRR
jgi:hypothetical protein